MDQEEVERRDVSRRADPMISGTFGEGCQIYKTKQNMASQRHLTAPQKSSADLPR